MNEAQPDLLGGTPPKPAKKASPKTVGGHQAKSKKPAPARPPSGGSSGKKPGTAVAVDDPAKRQQVAAQQPNSLLAVIMQAATNPACDVQKMQALLDMQRQLEERDSQKAFNQAFIRLQSELPVIRTDRKIEIRAKSASGERDGKMLQATPYATLPGIMKAIQPLLTKHGFALSFATDPLPDGRILVRGFLDGYGHQRSTAFPLPAETSGSKNNIQGWGSSQSYGRRYCTLALLNIVSHAPEDADTDGHAGTFKRGKDDSLVESTEVETLTEMETAQLDRKMIDCKVPLAKVLEHYDIKKLSDLPRDLLAAALKGCDDYAENQKRKAGGK